MNTPPRIAVVDDEMVVAKDLESTLRSFGYDVPGPAPTGAEAIALATASKPDLMLMDIRLRGELDGIETARQIQAQLDVPIVYVTAFADEETLARARETHPFGYLVKPVQDDALRSTVTTALTRHRAERQTRTSLRRQRALLDALGHLLWTAREDGRADYFNQRWHDYTGLTLAGSRGFGWVTALNPTDMHACLGRWKEAIRLKAGFEMVCSVLQAESRGYRRHLLRVVALPDAAGGPQWLATLTDIHDHEQRREVSRLAGTGSLPAPAPAPAAGAVPPPAGPGVPKDFGSLFCAARNCSPLEFADRVFLLSLYFHALPLVVVLWPWRRRCFAQDYALIEQAGALPCAADPLWELARLRTKDWLGGPLRRWLRLRISTTSLGGLMKRTAAEAPKS